METRIKIIRFFILGLILIITVHLIYLQGIRGKYYYSLSKNNRIRVMPIKGTRGRIFDRNGTVIADNRRVFNVILLPQEINDKEELFNFLSEALHKDKADLLRVYKRRIFAPFAPVILAEDIDWKMAVVLEENRFRFPSLLVQEGAKRVYPFKRISSHVLGYVGKINPSRMKRVRRYGYTPQGLIGYTGVEEYYDEQLRGEEGGRQIEVNSRGHQVRLLGLKEPIGGKDITLTIDQKMQGIAYELLLGRKGAIVVMDQESGELLVLASSPSFDPNAFVQGGSRKINSLFTNPSSPLLNRAVTGAYPPGSVFKIPVAICALDSQKINKKTTYFCKGFYEVGKWKFGCEHIHHSQTLSQAIAHSCNVYFYSLGALLGNELINRYAKILGLGALTGVDLPFESRGHIPSRSNRAKMQRRRWFLGDTLNLSIGQGDTLTTPLQLAAMMAFIANDGKQVIPHVIKRIGKKEIDHSFSGREVTIDKRIFSFVKKGMRDVVKEVSGTAHVLDISGIKVSGKTGTAQVHGKESHSWFAGYGVNANSKLSFSVFLENGGSSHEACLLLRKFLRNLLREKMI